MLSDQAGRQKDVNDNAVGNVCLHQRMVDYHYDDQHQRTGLLLCKECGEVIPDPLKSV